MAAAQDEALDILFFDQHLREYLNQEQGIAHENQVFLIGRPVSDLIYSFGFRIEEDRKRKNQTGTEYPNLKGIHRSMKNDFAERPCTSQAPNTERFLA